MVKIRRVEKNVKFTRHCVYAHAGSQAQDTGRVGHARSRRAHTCRTRWNKDAQKLADCVHVYILYAFIKDPFYVVYTV